MIQTFLTGLREGLEAALVIGIMVAYLVRSGHKDRLRPVWIGVSSAIVLSLALGGALELASKELPEGAEETFAGVMSILAVCLVTWMVFWMKATARRLKTELHDRIDAALAMGSTALAVAAFLAVAREGLETALFLWPTLRSGGAGAPVGAVLGLATSTLFGYLIYRRSVNLNLATFFRLTGIALVVIAAGVLSHGIHDLQEAGVIGGESSLLFDVSRSIPETGWLATLLKGTISFDVVTTKFQAAAGITYLVSVMYMFLRSASPAPVRQASA
jgi:high-affinity iron transporter